MIKQISPGCWQYSYSPTRNATLTALHETAARAAALELEAAMAGYQSYYTAFRRAQALGVSVRLGQESDEDSSDCG